MMANRNAACRCAFSALLIAALLIGLDRLRRVGR